MMPDRENPYQHPEYREAWERARQAALAREPMPVSVRGIATRRGYQAGENERRPDLMTWAHSVAALVDVVRDVAENDPGITALNAARLRDALEPVAALA